MRTQVGILGAGPAGLMLAHLLHLRGIECVVLEARSRDYVERRVRAGVLEHGTVELLKQCGVGERLLREGMRHNGVNLRFRGETHRIDFPSLTGGRSITVYGQREVVKDLIQARLAYGGALEFEAEGQTLSGLDGPRPAIHYRKDGVTHVLECDYVAGCDGFHGIARAAIPAGVLTTYERVYPFAWLGILAEAAPSAHELIYANHVRGFALREHALAKDHAQLSASAAGRGHRQLAGCAHLGGVADPAGHPGRLRAADRPAD